MRPTPHGSTNAALRRRGTPRLAAAVAAVVTTAALAACSGSDAAEDTTSTSAAERPSTTTEAPTSTIGPGSIRCEQVVVVLDMDPGISMTPTDQQVDLTGDLSSCVGEASDAPDGATLDMEGIAEDVVAAPGDPGSVLLEVAGTIGWTDGTSSRGTARIVALDLSEGSPVGLELTVVEGPFTGGSSPVVPLGVDQIVPGSTPGSMVNQTFTGTDVVLGPAEG